MPRHGSLERLFMHFSSTQKAEHFCWNAPSFLHIRMPFDFTQVCQSMILSQHVTSSSVDTRTTRGLALTIGKINFDEKQEEYQFGDNLTEEEKDELVNKVE